MPTPMPTEPPPAPLTGPWVPHIDAIDHGYQIRLIRRNTTQPRNKEQIIDPWPTITLRGARRRAMRLARRQNRLTARAAARQALIDLTPYIDDAKNRTRP